MTVRVDDLAPMAVMGIVNVTPDSFSDGGRFVDHGAAIAHGLELAAQGAAIVDVGGESTRPGAAPVDADVEVARVLPVVAALAREGVRVSIDTHKADVARAALDAGAVVVNDVTGGADVALLDAVRVHDAGLVVMHMRGAPRTMQDDPRYGDVVREVGDALVAFVARAVAAGVRADAIWADPGIGFGKTAAHNLALLAHARVLRDHVGVPLLVGTSRKGFLGTINGGVPPVERDDATLATTVALFVQGVSVVRVHDVAPSVRAARLLDVMARATQAGVVAA